MLAAFRDYYDYDDHFDDHRRLVGRASYYGLCSFVDDLVGKVLASLEEAGRAGDTPSSTPATTASSSASTAFGPR